jgi:hypothetical protein
VGVESPHEIAGNIKKPVEMYEKVMLGGLKEYFEVRNLKLQKNMSVRVQ